MQSDISGRVSTFLCISEGIDVRAMKEALSLVEAGMTVNIVRRSTTGASGYELIDGVHYYTTPAIDDGQALLQAIRSAEIKRTLIWPARAMLGLFAYLSIWGGYSIAQAKITRPAYRRIARLKSRFTRMLVRRLHLLLRYHLYVCEYVPVGMTLTDTDVVHAHDLYMLRSAVGLKKLLGTKCVYDAHELESERRVDTHWLLRKLIIREEVSMVKHADAVITVGPMIADLMARNLGVARPTVILNAPPHPNLDKTADPVMGLRERLGLSPETPLILFVGKIFDHEQQDHKSALLAQAVSDLENVHLVFLGPMGGKAQAQLADMRMSLEGGDRIHRLDPVPVEELVATISDATVGVSIMPPHCLNTDLAFPNKLCEYLLADVTILSFENRQIMQIVEPLGRGVFVADVTREGLREGLRRAIVLNEDRRTNAQLTMDMSQFSWKPQALNLIGLYAEIMSSNLDEAV